MDLWQALQRLQRLMGEKVQDEPGVTPGRGVIHVDGVPHTEEEIVKWFRDGIQPEKTRITSGRRVIYIDGVPRTEEEVTRWAQERFSQEKSEKHK